MCEGFARWDFFKSTLRWGQALLNLHVEVMDMPEHNLPNTLAILEISHD